ncbi:MAG: hypothetical protein AAGC49_01015 [Brevundimonas sp.]
MSIDPELVNALVTLAETLEQVNSRIRQSAESHTEVEPMANLSVQAIMHILRDPGATVAEIAAAVGYPAARLQQALDAVVRNGLATVDGSGRAARYTPTARAGEIRRRARERSTQIFRYALTPMSPEGLAALTGAHAAINELSRNLGFRDVAEPDAD